MMMTQTRRRFLDDAIAGGAATLVRPPRALAAEGPLETTSVRFMRTPSLCHAPQFVVEDLLWQEGFTDIKYVSGASSADINEAIVSGKVDFNLHFAPQWASIIDGGGAVTVLAGVHVGCFELFGKAGIRSIADLKGKAVGVAALGSSDHLFVSVMAAHIGLDPANDIHWVTSHPRRRPSCSQTARSTPALVCRRCRRNCAPATWAMSSSTARWTARGRSISAACWPATGSTVGNIQPRPNASCAPS